MSTKLFSPLPSTPLTIFGSLTIVLFLIIRKPPLFDIPVLILLEIVLFVIVSLLTEIEENHLH